MDDETLGPFVDALASALIVMVLVAVFFLIQSAASLTQSAKLITESDNTVKEKKFSPIIFRKPLSVNFEKREIRYIVNFALTESDIKTIREQILLDKKVTFTFYSDSSDKKTTVNLIRLLKELGLPRFIEVNNSFQKANSSISKLTWE